MPSCNVCTCEVKPAYVNPNPSITARLNLATLTYEFRICRYCFDSDMVEAMMRHIESGADAEKLTGVYIDTLIRFRQETLGVTTETLQALTALAINPQSHPMLFHFPYNDNYPWRALVSAYAWRVINARS